MLVYRYTHVLHGTVPWRFRNSHLALSTAVLPNITLTGASSSAPAVVHVARPFSRCPPTPHSNPLTHLFQCRLSHHMRSQLSLTSRGPPPSCSTLTGGGSGGTLGRSVVGDARQLQAQTGLCFQSTFVQGAALGGCIGASMLQGQHACGGCTPRRHASACARVAHSGVLTCDARPRSQCAQVSVRWVRLRARSVAYAAPPTKLQRSASRLPHPAPLHPARTSHMWGFLPDRASRRMPCSLQQEAM